MNIKWLERQPEAYWVVLHLDLFNNLKATLDYCSDEEIWILEAVSDDQPGFYVYKIFRRSDPRPHATKLLKNEIREYMETIKDKADAVLRKLESI
jgi:hypothetical protein